MKLDESIICQRKDIPLSKKEARLLDFLVKYGNKGINVTIGDVCRECKTTPKTLLGKTWPELKRKIAEGVLSK